MVNHRKMIVFSILIIMCLSLITGCEEKPNHGQKTIDSKLIQQQKKEKEAYTAELKSVKSSTKVTIANDKPCQILFVPKTQEAVISEVISWLQKAKLYKGEMPKSKNPGELAFNAYVGPSILEIYTSDNHKITILPAFYYDKNGCPQYINNVLVFSYDKKVTYVESDELYDWLKNDKWTDEFKQK